MKDLDLLLLSKMILAISEQPVTPDLHNKYIEMAPIFKSKM